MPFLATMPITIIRPMNDATLNSIRVIKSAKNTPDVESTAEDRIASGAEYEPGAFDVVLRSGGRQRRRSGADAVDRRAVHAISVLWKPADETGVGTMRTAGQSYDSTILFTSLKHYNGRYSDAYQRKRCRLWNRSGEGQDLRAFVQAVGNHCQRRDRAGKQIGRAHV